MFTVKYRKALLDDEVVKIIKQTAVGIEQRYAIDVEAMGMDTEHIHLLYGAHPKIFPRTDSANIQKHNSQRDISDKARGEKVIVGMGILNG